MHQILILPNSFGLLLLYYRTALEATTHGSIEMRIINISVVVSVVINIIIFQILF